MRDQRWVHRFLFAWNDTLFFDPLDVYYKPRKDHFLADLDERTRARFVRSGIWWSHRHNPHLPTQGWKIHVSSHHRQVREVAATVIGHLVSREIDFKIALDLNVFEMLNSKAMSRGSGGKLITVYPRDEDEFRTCLADLARLLEGAEGAYVLSDQRYRDSRALYFRYGQLLSTHTVDILGRKIPHILGPDGQPESDDRRPGNTHPWWVPWPFSDWKPAEEAEGEGLLGGRFRVTGALQFSNSGGVYTAEDTLDGDRQVVLKEARPHTNLNPRLDYDAVDVLGREWMFLNRLADVEAYPDPIARFRHWEHHYIAEEFVDRTDIRSVLLEHNPLARPGFDPERAREYLRIFITVFRGLARAIDAAHAHGVVLGDFTPANLLIDPDTFDVTIVDLEACRLVDGSGATGETSEGGLERPVELYTPGFSLSRGGFKAAGIEGDLFSLASTMAYFVFPIAAMSYLREDVLDTYRVFFDGLGWPEEVHRLVTDLAAARLGLAEVVELLDAQEADLLARVSGERPRPEIEPSGLRATEAGVAAFVEAAADTERATLFPVDPFAHVTNPLSLGFGASGVLWSLHASGVPVRPEWHDWLRQQLTRINLEAYPDGLMSGLAGIAWAAESLGMRRQARELLGHANRRALETADHTFYYGLSGIGMTNLRFYLRSGDPRDLAAAKDCARMLLETVHRDGEHAYWLNDFSEEGPLTGLGFGQAGVAMFLLRMHQVTGEQRYRDLGRDALAWEMAHAKPLEDSGLIMFEHEGTMEPYIEVGSAGVAQVLLRYGDLESARSVLRALDVGHSVLPGYSFGMSGIADALLDAAEITGDASYRETALRQLDFLRKVFLFEPAAHFEVPRRAGVTPLGVPGEGLLRCSTDYLTGSAGVLRVLHRANHGGMADFLLDELDGTTP